MTVLQFLLALGLALLLNQNLRFRWLARALAMVPWAMPQVVVGIMWRLVYHPNAGILNETPARRRLLGHNIDWLNDFATALPAVIVVGVWAGMPQTTVVLLAGLQGVPEGTARGRRHGRRRRLAPVPDRHLPHCGRSSSRSPRSTSSGTSTRSRLVYVADPGRARRPDPAADALRLRGGVPLRLVRLRGGDRRASWSS